MLNPKKDIIKELNKYKKKNIFKIKDKDINSNSKYTKVMQPLGGKTHFLWSERIYVKILKPKI